MKEIFFNSIFPVILSILMILWIYSLWFFSKYDKKTNYLLLLLFLNIYYTPFYLFRIQKIRKENKIKRIGEEIYDSEFITDTRSSIIETLKLWTTKHIKTENQDFENDSNLTEELFTLWNDFYRIDYKILIEAFNESELELLKTFDKTIIVSQTKYINGYPEINKFQESNDWKVIHKLASEISNEIK